MPPCRMKMRGVFPVSQTPAATIKEAEKRGHPDSQTSLALTWLLRAADHLEVPFAADLEDLSLIAGVTLPLDAKRRLLIGR
jgi:hypothetical protein